jgi:hypothetical protein
MVETMPPTISGDEILLAQLACVKLAKLVQGAFSVGLSALQTEAFDAPVFFEERFRVLTGFALVLHSIGGRPGSTEEVLRFRAVSSKLLKTLESLRNRMIAQLKSSKGHFSDLVAIQQSAAALCDTIREYAVLLQVDLAPIEKATAVVMQTFEAVERLEAIPTHSPR